MASSALKQQNFIVSNNNNKNTLFYELWGPDVTSVMFLNVSWSCCYNLEMKRFDLEVPIREQIHSLFSIMKKQKELEERVLLHSPPGFEVFLINLSHLLSFTCQFSSRPALSTGPSSCLPLSLYHHCIGMIRANWSDDLHSRRQDLQLPHAQWNEDKWWARLIFSTPGSNFFLLTWFHSQEESFSTF